MAIETSNLVDVLTTASQSLRIGWQITPERDVIRVTWFLLNVGAHHISGTAEARVVKFCKLLRYINQVPGIDLGVNTP